MEFLSFLLCLYLFIGSIFGAGYTFDKYNRDTIGIRIGAFILLLFFWPWIIAIAILGRYR